MIWFLIILLVIVWFGTLGLHDIMSKDTADREAKRAYDRGYLDGYTDHVLRRSRYEGNKFRASSDEADQKPTN